MPPDTSEARPRGRDALQVQADGPDTSQGTSDAHLAAEVALIGAMTHNAEARDRVPRMVSADDFDREAHRVLFEVICELHDEGSPVDQIIVNDRLIGTGRIEVVGGLVGIFDCTSVEGCPSVNAWPSYATIVAREARRRRDIVALRRAVSRLEAGEDPAVVAAELEVAA